MVIQSIFFMKLHVVLVDLNLVFFSEVSGASGFGGCIPEQSICVKSLSKSWS
jgi:hypothetical protein